MRRVPWVELAVAGLSILLLVLLANRQVAQQNAPPTYATYSSYDAYPGGYRAWYELLRAEGVAVERFERRAAYLDRSVDTLVYAENAGEGIARGVAGRPTDSLTNADAEAITLWVQQGGRLVFLRDGSVDGFARGERTTPFASQPPAGRGAASDRAVAIVASPLADGVTELDGTGKLRITGVDITPIIADDGGGVVGVRRVGKGEVVYVSDESLFTNARLAKTSNARLALNLAVGGRAAGRRGVVAFEELTHGYNAGDSLWGVLPWPARAAIVIAAAALLVLLAGEFFRFGPTAPALTGDERSSAEYLTSVANLLSRGRAARVSLRDLASLCVRDVAGALGLPDNAPLKLLAARLEGAHPDSVAALYELTRLRANEHPSDQDLMRAARLALAIRKDIASHARIGIGRRLAPVRRTA